MRTQIEKELQYISLSEFTNLYLDYVNNYLTVEKFASDKGLSIEDAEFIFTTGRAIGNYEFNKGE